ncbi:LytTR family DNA-binding domain-containing protein [Lutibacter sp. Hel_I_33_5]|uniref:LytR/AlgR family response regulator transcription factor n=1 Tax=Lutibacter sp. Hel_I_33_5 TaxID=1566289 RepID=UPI0016440825|nr:LytTR family DNA-binding domain-containing protein [Lutibacter sp. Hel_I_33_5]
MFFISFISLFLDFYSFYQFKELQANSNKVIIKCNKKSGDLITLYKSAILFFESNKTDLKIFFKENETIRELQIKKKLKTIEANFCNPEFGFYKCHKSFIINLSKITEIQGNSRAGKVTLENNFSIPVSRNKVSDLKNILSS